MEGLVLIKRAKPGLTPLDAGIAVQHFFVVRLVRLDEAAHNGPEFSDPSRGGYELDRVDLLGEERLSSI